PFSSRETFCQSHGRWTTPSGPATPELISGTYVSAIVTVLVIRREGIASSAHDENIRSFSSAVSSCHSERSEESRINVGRRLNGNRPEMFRFAQHDNAICETSWLR